MRKATWGGLLLALFALTFGAPIRGTALHGPLSVAGLGGYLLLSMSPATASPKARRFLVAGAIAGLASFLLVVLDVPFPGDVAARALAVGSVALPLWLAAGPAQFAFAIAAALALFTGLPAIASVGDYATSVHAYVASAGALWTAWRMEGGALPGAKKPKRQVVASNIVTLTPLQKAERLAALEAAFKAGGIPEHVYLDKRQELESR